MKRNCSASFFALRNANHDYRQVYDWQTDFGNIGPTQPTGDPTGVSTQLRAKYSTYFASCS